VLLGTYISSGDVHHGLWLLIHDLRVLLGNVLPTRSPRWLGESDAVRSIYLQFLVMRERGRADIFASRGVCVCCSSPRFIS
jgi:hypothetical protein